MKTNPGGQLEPDNIRGRDAFIAELWRILEGRSIYMNDLRRIGKTQIMRKMAAEHSPNWKVKLRDLGGISTAAEFASQVYKDADEIAPSAWRSIKDLIGGMRGTEIPGVIKLPDGKPAPWKQVLSNVFQDLHAYCEKEGMHILFLWDEVPFMLEKIRKKETEDQAMEVLDVLRALSNDYPNVRMLLTASVGLHHVLNTLKAAGYNNDPLNTMDHVAPGPLGEEEAITLATDLLQGEKLLYSDLLTVSQTISTLCGRVPFYIHRLIARLPRDSKHTPESIEATLRKELVRSDDDWNFAHYRSRIRIYYGPTNEIIILAILDSIAIHADALTFQKLSSLVKAKCEIDDERIRDQIKLLIKDYYIRKDPEGGHHFYLNLLEKWWCIDRGLV